MSVLNPMVYVCVGHPGFIPYEFLSQPGQHMGVCGNPLGKVPCTLPPPQQGHTQDCNLMPSACNYHCGEQVAVGLHQ